MIKINNFRYEDNGIAIVFDRWKSTSNKYSFSVEGNEELTALLRASVKAKAVPEYFTEKCAAALFASIEDGEFKPLTSGKDFKELCRKFYQRFSEEALFDLTDLSTESRPRFMARLTNYSWEGAKSGEGRTMNEAKADALRNLTTYLDS